MFTVALLGSLDGTPRIIHWGWLQISIANLIVIEKAARRGIAISFWSYARVGIPLTLLTLCAGIGWLSR